MDSKLEESIKRVEVLQLDARFAAAARDRIVEFLQSSHSFEPTLGLLYGDVPADGSGKGTWSITAYCRSTVDEMIEMYGSFGAVVCYEIDGIRTVIPQMGHIDELESVTLDFVGNRLQPVVPGQA